MTAALNSFADRINEQPGSPLRAADVLSGIAPLLRVQRVEVEEVCRFASAWKSAHEAQTSGWAQFHIVTKGQCRVDLHGQRLDLHKGSVLLIPGGDAHSVQSAKGTARQTMPIRIERGGPVALKTNTVKAADTELICGRLQFDAAASSLVICGLPPAVIVNVESEQPLGHMRMLVRMIDAELRSARPGALAVAADLSSALFVLMLRVHLEQGGASSSTLLSLLGCTVCARATKAMVSSPARGWTLDELAGTSHVSRATLVRAFKKAAGMAPLAFLQELRLNLARRNLASSKASLAQVSAAVGYASESAFVRAFSRRFGVSPGKWRPK